MINRAKLIKIVLKLNKNKINKPMKIHHKQKKLPNKEIRFDL